MSYFQEVAAQALIGSGTIHLERLPLISMEDVALFDRELSRKDVIMAFNTFLESQGGHTNFTKYVNIREMVEPIVTWKFLSPLKGYNGYKNN